jgi:benzoyl-CoA reductase/2-hydroxyglutaryl-CoA dehydratase subunit BcrC/BadD/HgdB
MPAETDAQVAKKLSDLMSSRYRADLAAAEEGAFVVWVAIIVPIELLKGFDLVVAVPENHSAMCAAKGVGATLAENAERAGYSMDLCSYARIDLGSVAAAENSLTASLPKPDLLVSDNNNCSHLVKWFDVHHRELDVPHFVLDVPFCYGPQQEKDLEYIAAQYRDLIETIERMTGRRFDGEKARRAIEYTNEAVAHWKRFLDLAANRPSGITAFDTFVHMAPYITSLRGTKELVDYYKFLADETESRVAEGKFPVPNERFRLMWDNIAPWHQLRKMSTRLARMDANIVCAPYTSCIGTVEGEIDHHRYDGSDPIRFLARTQNFSICPYGLELRFRLMSKLVERYGVDGIIFASNRSCKVYSIMQMDIQRRMAEQYHLPTVMIDLDHADVRMYNEEKAFLQIEALIENLEPAVSR